MSVPYPPLPADELEQLKARLRVTPSKYREDALQEAWLKHLEGKSAIAAVVNYSLKERLYERRHIDFSQMEDGEVTQVENATEIGSYTPET